MFDTLSCNQAERKSLQSITIHPDYKRRFKYNDIAIIELDEPVDFSYNVWPACLPQKKMDDTAQTQLHIAGFGLSEDESSLNVILNL